MRALSLLFLSALVASSSQVLSFNSSYQNVRLVLTFGSDESHKDILEQIPENFFLYQLTYSSDCPLERAELCSVLGFDSGNQMTREQLYGGIRRLGYKEKFDYVTLYATESDGGWSLHMVLSARWTLAKVRCKGSLLGKERYRHQYRIEPGQRFDAIKHHDALVAIEDLMHAEGYLDPDVLDVVVYNDLHKTVDVTLALDAGKYYSMRSFDFECKDLPLKNTILLKLKNMCLRELYGFSYSKGLVQQVERHLEELCVKEGFLQAAFTHTYTCNYENRTVGLLFHGVLGERRQFSFFGNHFFSDRQLLDRLLLFGKSVLVVPPTLLAQELTDLYKNKGFWQVSVTYQEEDDACIFCTVEGPRARIADVSFEGVHYFSIEHIKNLCSDFKRNVFFDKRLQRQCRDDIMQAYVRAGFWDCVVTHGDAVMLGDTNSYRYHFVVQEGPQRLLACVRIEGFDDRCDELLSQAPFVACLCLQEPIPFDMYLVQEQRRALLDYAQKKGYLLANPKPDLRHSDAGLIDLVWTVEHATQVTFGTTVLAGESKLPPALIRRELLYEKGQVWDQKKVDRSVARLKALGIFDKVTLQPVVEKHQEREQGHSQDLVLTCIDDDPFEMRLRAGMQCIGQYFEFHDIGFRAGGSLICKNPFNNAGRIELVIDSVPHDNYGQLSYIAPRFFSLPVTSTTSVYASRFDQALVNCFQERLYRLEQDGFSLELERSDNGEKYGCCFGFETMKIFDISRRLAALIDFDPRLVGQRVPYFYAEPVLVKNYVDDLMNPTSGTTSTITGKIMVPLNNKASGFIKILLEQSLYVSLKHAGWIGAVHLRAGHIFNTDFDTVMPPERFYLGGAYSLRGYDTDMAPPVHALSDRRKNACLLPVGGKTVLNGMFELRFPLHGSLSGVFFNDCGILVRKKWHDDAFVGATGFGLRYATPVGPLRFDIAWKWRCQKGEEHRFAWFLTFGQAF